MNEEDGEKECGRRNKCKVGQKGSREGGRIGMTERERTEEGREGET